MFDVSLIKRYSRATDASMYYMLPESVVEPKTLLDIKEILDFAAKNQKGITFRAAGTSLSGQASTNGILVDISRNWKNFRISENGAYITSEPGVIAGHINIALKKFGRKLGPDPASINSCMIGGMVANNSSGMRSGTALTPYYTIRNLEFTLASGLTIDTRLKKQNEVLAYKHPEIFNGILSIRSNILNDTDLVNKIQSKYKIKNTIGYQLNSFLDFDTPVDILAHLMIGSEGTLGFISEVEFETFPEKAKKLTGLVFFKNMRDACSVLVPMKQSGASALELMDRTSLSAVESQTGFASIIKELPLTSAALLFEYQADEIDELENFYHLARNILSQVDLQIQPIITTDTKEQARLWKVRQGLLPSLGAARNPGSTFIIEDVAFKIEDLTDAIESLRSLFDKYQYKQVGIYGHGIDGNLHFMIAPEFQKTGEITRFESFMSELAYIVVKKFDGSLKAEHGTGRNMAPFVEYEWGSIAYEYMKEIKNLLDPNYILNPGVLINNDRNSHIKNIKKIPVIDSKIDYCIECGFCEPVCPSRELTLTPRQRISLRRRMPEIIENLRIGTSNESSSLEVDYKYYSIDTCAVDGLCAIACPLGINTGDLTKKQRAANITPFANIAANAINENIGTLIDLSSASVSIANNISKLTGSELINKVSDLISRLSGLTLYKWNNSIGTPAKIKPTKPQVIDSEKIEYGINTFVYFPCCMSKIMGTPKSNTRPNLIDSVIELSSRVGLSAYLPSDSVVHCCGMSFSSKGFTEAYAKSANSLVEAMYDWSNGGVLPVVADSSSCAYTMKNCKEVLYPENLDKWHKLTILDLLEFLHDYTLDKLRFTKKVPAVALHPVCSVRKSGLEEKFISIARKCADYVYVPELPECCGYAGDRGFLFPELSDSSAKREANQILEQNIRFSGYYSSNISCEIGMSNALKKEFVSIIYLLLEATE